MTRYEEFCMRGRSRYGSQFNTSSVAQKFVGYYNSRERIRVQFPGHSTMDGYVGVTTGYTPVFILVYNRRSLGSSIVLDDEFNLVKVFRSRSVKK